MEGAFGTQPAAGSGADEQPLRHEPEEGDRSHSPAPGWSPWLAPIALILGLAMALVGGAIVDLPAAALGANLSGKHFPAGLTVVDTVIQDLAFIGGAVYCAKLGGRVVRSWQFGLRAPAAGWRSAARMIVLLLLAFVILNVVWAEAFQPERDHVLNELGSNEGQLLLIASAALTCVVAPICEEFLFRGFIFTALREWRGTLPAAIISGLVFGGVHAGSAPALDLLPLAALGFGLCLLYRHTGSLYPGIVAHSLNNSIAFASLEGWGWQAPVLIVASIAAIAAIVTVCAQAGLVGPLRLPRVDP
ncbi:MAG TPA: type II CAAX endopeptidase family protein [Solirubrobacteraceae bacterium]|jgi:hypothetical protein